MLLVIVPALQTLFLREQRQTAPAPDEPNAPQTAE